MKAIWFLLLLASLGPSATVLAQEGHPLTGTWDGEWGPEGDRRQVTIVMSWDGSDANGIMNPGPYSAVAKVTLDSSTWTVHIEAVGRDASGEPVTYVADGTMEDVGSRRRSIVGTWRSGDAESEFRLTRQE